MTAFYNENDPFMAGWATPKAEDSEAAGAEIRSLGRVRWREVESGEPMPGPSPICAFVLRGDPE